MRSCNQINLRAGSVNHLFSELKNNWTIVSAIYSLTILFCLIEMSSGQPSDSLEMTLLTLSLLQIKRLLHFNYIFLSEMFTKLTFF